MTFFSQLSATEWVLLIVCLILVVAIAVVAGLFITAPSNKSGDKKEKPISRDARVLEFLKDPGVIKFFPDKLTVSVWRIKPGEYFLRSWKNDPNLEPAIRKLIEIWEWVEINYGAKREWGLGWGFVVYIKCDHEVSWVDIERMLMESLDQGGRAIQDLPSS